MRVQDHLSGMIGCSLTRSPGCAGGGGGGRGGRDREGWGSEPYAIGACGAKQK